MSLRVSLPNAARPSRQGTPPGACSALLQELLPLAQAVTGLKDKVVKGRAPVAPRPPANPDQLRMSCGCCQRPIAVMGGVQNILSTLDANHGNVSLSNQMALTDIGQLDMGFAATELNGYSTALQATYKAYSRIGSMSLFAAL